MKEIKNMTRTNFLITALRIAVAAFVLISSPIAHSQNAGDAMEFHVFKKNLLALDGKRVKIYAGLEKPRACTTPSFEKYYCLELVNNGEKEVVLIEKSKKNIKELIELADERLPLEISGRVVSTNYKATTISGLIETTESILYVETIRKAPAIAVILTPIYTDWEYIVTDDSDREISYNQEELYTGNGYISIWLKIDLKMPQKLEDGRSYNRTITRNVFDCRQFARIQKSIVFYSSRGVYLESGTNEIKESFKMNDGKVTTFIFNKLKKLC